jgi:aldose 1-epimerase
MSVSPSGTSWTLRGGGYEATVVSVGGGIRSLTYEGRDVLIGYGAGELCHAGIGQLLIPWPNRIADGRYAFAGTDQQLALTEPARHNASHGLTRWSSWERTGDAPNEAVVTHRLHGLPGYPHQLDLSVSYRLDESGLAVTVDATNVGGSEAPYGFGAHPYLTVGRRIDQCELTFGAGQRLDVDPDRLLPRDLVDVDEVFDFSRGRRVGDLQVDNAFTGLGSPWTVRLTDPDSGASAALQSDTTWMQLYTADALDRAGLAVEPMTCPPNAFATGTDLVVLAPGDTHTTSFTIRASG